MVQKFCVVVRLGSPACAEGRGLMHVYRRQQVFYLHLASFLLQAWLVWERVPPSSCAVVKTVNTVLVGSEIVHHSKDLTVGVCLKRVGPPLLQASFLLPLPLPHIKELAELVPELCPSRLIKIFQLSPQL